MQDLFEPPVVDEAAIAAARARRRSRVCFLILAVVIGVHVLTAFEMVHLLPFTADENHHLAAGMALRNEYVFTAEHTILQGPLPFYATQAATVLWDAPLDMPFDPTASNKIHGRLGMLLFTVVAIILLARLAWRHLGPLGAISATACYALNPIVLGNSVLMNADLALTATWLLCIMAMVHHLTRPSAYRAAGVGISFGLAMATSYAAMFLMPVLLVATGLWLFSPAEPGRRRSMRIAPMLGHLLMGGVTALITIHACYQFSAPLYDPAITPPKGGLLESFPPLANLAQLLPDPLVRGIELQTAGLAQFDTIPFLGEMRGASIWYYVVALGTKLPLAFLVLLGISLFSRKGHRRWPAPLTWTVSAALAIPFLYMSVFARYQPGVRIVLPLLPLLILFAVRPVQTLWNAGGRFRLVVLTLAAWMVFNAVTLWPNYLSAFNALAGARPFNLFGDTTMDWRLQPHRDPTRNFLFKKYPDAKPIHFKSGPRFGVVIVYALDLWPKYDRKRGPVHHWVRDFDPIDHAGPYFVFKFTEDHFRLGLFEDDPAVVARNRRNLAIALLGAGKFLEVDALLEKGPDLPLVRRQLALARAKNDTHALLNGWMALGRYDHVLGHRGATPAQKGQCYVELGRYHECRRVLEAEMKRRQLSVPEQQFLILAQIRDRAIDRAILTSRRHPPTVGTEQYRAHEEFLGNLRTLWNEYEQLMRQIGAQPGK